MFARKPALEATSTRLDDVSDVEMLRHVANRDHAAFETFFHRFHRRVYQFAYRMLRDPALAEETVNDVMVVVWNSASRFRGTSKVSTWVLGITHRKALKALQRDARHPASDEDCELQIDPAPKADPLGSLDARNQLDQLGHALASLSMEKRSVVELTAMGYAYPEIAAIVGCPENTVKTRMFYARRQLRIAMHDGPCSTQHGEKLHKR